MLEQPLVCSKKIIALKLSTPVDTRTTVQKNWYLSYVVGSGTCESCVKRGLRGAHRFHESAANSSRRGRGGGKERLGGEEEGRLRISCGHVAFGGPVYRLRHIRFPPFFLRVLSSFSSSSASSSARLCSDGKTLTSR